MRTTKKTDTNNETGCKLNKSTTKTLDLLTQHTFFTRWTLKDTYSTNQHGFVPGRSAQTNLSVFTQFVCKVLDQRGQVDVVYTDLSSAFDSVDHSILLNKLDMFGVGSSFLALLRSYLINRLNYVYYNGYKSFDYMSTSGVPQGSNLGPLLFLLFINDLLMSTSCSILGFADDVKLFSPVSSANDVDHLQNNINLIVQWCSDNHLKLNTNKCFYVSFCRNNSVIPSIYYINGQFLVKTDTIRDLGVIFDHRLSFSQHIIAITSSASKSLGFVMRSATYFKNTDLLKSLYSSFVRSKLEYVSIVWSPCYLTYQLLIERVQRRFLKFLSFKTTGVYPARNVHYETLLQQHNMQSLTSRRNLQSAHFMWKIIHDQVDCPNILSEVNFHVPRRNDRHAVTFSFPTSRTNILKNSPLCRLCKNANDHYADIFFQKK